MNGSLSLWDYRVCRGERRGAIKTEYIYRGPMPMNRVAPCTPWELTQAFRIHIYLSSQKVIHLFRGHKSEYPTKNTGVTRTRNMEWPSRRLMLSYRREACGRRAQSGGSSLKATSSRAELGLSSECWSVLVRGSFPHHRQRLGREQSPRLNLMTTSGPKKKCFPPRSLSGFWAGTSRRPLRLAPPSETTEC